MKAPFGETRNCVVRRMVKKKDYFCLFYRYYIGTPVLFGLIGSSCIILSSVLYAVTFYSVLTGNR